MKRFEMTEEHVKLLRAAYVSWEDSEFGAPGIDTKRPYGNSDVVRSMARILGVPMILLDGDESGLRPGTTDHMVRLHKETETALHIVLRTGSFEPGVYVADDYHQNWRAAKLKESDNATT